MASNEGQKILEELLENNDQLHFLARRLGDRVAHQAVLEFISAAKCAH